MNILPSEPLSENSFNSHLTNLFADFATALQKTSEQAVLDWADESKTEENIFMEDRIRERLLSGFIGFLVTTQPRSDQLSNQHLDDYFRILSTPKPPASDPVSKE